jgi:hypothetical protein
MAWFLLTVCTVTPALAYAAVVALLPGGDRRPVRRLLSGRRGTSGAAGAGATGRRRRSLLHRRPAAPPLPDPFDALQVQTRLAIVAEHIRRLEEDRHAWARAERIIAAQLAYDALLAQACRMAGVEVLPRAKGDPWERLREEVELIARGWTW